MLRALGDLLLRLRRDSLSAFGGERHVRVADGRFELALELRREFLNSVVRFLPEARSPLIEIVDSLRVFAIAKHVSQPRQEPDLLRLIPNVEVSPQNLDSENV